MRNRLSTLRQKIIEIFQEKNSSPLCVHDIQILFPKVHKTSIYRAMEYLQREGFLESFVLPCTSHGTQTYYISRHQHNHFFHCEKCHRFFPLENCPLPQTVFSQPYQITQHVFYLVGICPDCFSHNNQNSDDDKKKVHNAK